jgi:beta-xylosidase
VTSSDEHYFAVTRSPIENSGIVLATGERSPVASREALVQGPITQSMAQVESETLSVRRAPSVNTLKIFTTWSYFQFTGNRGRSRILLFSEESVGSQRANSIATHHPRMASHVPRGRTYLAVVAVLVVLVASSVIPPGAEAARTDFTSTAQSATLVYDQNFPDPSVLVVDHTYYAYSTNSGGDDVPVIESHNLTHWKAIGDAMSVLPSWASGSEVWSPSVTVAPDGGYELFFSAYDQAEGVMCLGRATSSSPLGPFVDVSGQPFLCQASAGGSIDPSVVRFDGADYLVWKGDGEAGQAQVILSARLSGNDTELVGPTSTLLTATESWEDGIVEGPAFVEVSGVLYLFFSANQWNTTHYTMGETTCTSPLGPCVSTGVDQVSVSSNTASGAGGPSFFVTDGRTYMAFAAWANGIIGNASGHRAMFLMALDSQHGAATFEAASTLTATTWR